MRRLKWLDFVGQRIVEAAVQKKKLHKYAWGGALECVLIPTSMYKVKPRKEGAKVNKN